MSGRYSRNKGADGEREIVNFLKEHDIPCKRISMLETGHESLGDVEVAGIWKGQVKVGSHVPKFISEALAGQDMLFARRDRQKWTITMDLEWFIKNFFLYRKLPYSK
jgi:hypothetical protein